MTRTERTIQWGKFLERMQVKFVGKVYKALLSQYSSFTDDLKNYGVEYAKSKLTYEYLNTQIGGNLTGVIKIFKMQHDFIFPRCRNNEKNEPF